jgi:hypothetical protein
MSSTSALLPLLAAVALVLYRAVRISPSAGSKVGAVLAIVAGIAPAIWVMAARGVSTKLVIGYSALFFLGSVLMKWAVYLAVLSKHVHPHVSSVVGGIVQGVVSSACEMGVALVALSLVLPNLGFWQVFGFGAGAAAIEALMMSMMKNPHAGTAVGEHVATQVARLHEGATWLGAAVPFVERCIATTDHIACRGLVAAGVASGRVWPTAFAFLAFAATDGFAWYCLERRWEFAQPVVAVKLYGALALVAVCCAFAWRFAI